MSDRATPIGEEQVAAAYAEDLAMPEAERAEKVVKLLAQGEVVTALLMMMTAHMREIGAMKVRIAKLEAACSE